MAKQIDSSNISTLLQSVFTKIKNAFWAKDDTQQIGIDSVPTSDSANLINSSGVYNALSNKQDTLVSGVNIKTVGGTSILGEGNIPVSGGGTGGDINVIEIVKVNGTPLSPDANKAVNVIVPTSIGSLSDDSTHRTVTDVEKSTWNAKSDFSGNYSDLNGKPTIPAAQVQTDWNATSGMGKLLNKPTLSSVATSGSYNDLSDKPTIPAAQVQTDWNASTGIGSILNKPSLSTVATSGSYNDLSNKPSIPDAQVQTDWNASSGMGVILNKPTLASVATSGSYNDLSNKPTIPTVPTISTSVSADKASDVKTSSPKSVYDEVHHAIVSSQPAGGFAPNIIYDLGTLTGSVTFSLATPLDNTIANPYHWTFETGSTAPTVTWPSSLVWLKGSAPTISASKHYEILVRNGYASHLEWSLS